jgi:hypothetical protein
MSLMVTELYDALKDAGTTSPPATPKAKRATRKAPVA